MTTLEAVKPKTERVARTFSTIKADSKGGLPTRIEILKVGMWDTPNHGMFMITADDINEMIANFSNGVGLPGQGSIGAPIDFGHDSDDEAAGWMTALSTDGMTLFADVTWTTSGAAALNGGTYKCFSPEFYPGCRGGWEDPEESGECVPNVLVGGGLTNIPLFKGLKPIVASQSGGVKGDDDRNVIYISASKELSMPTLEEIRAKKFDQLSTEEKQFIAEHKAELTADESVQMGFTEAAVTPIVVEEDNKNKEGEEVVAETTTPVVEPELAAITASIKSGESMVVKASDWKQTQDTIAEYRKEKADAIVASHVARGAIKADQAKKWSERVIADKGVEELLADLPSNQLLASEVGSSDKSGTVISATDELRNRAKEAIKASKEMGTEIDFPTALSQVMAADTDLAERYNNETKG